MDVGRKSNSRCFSIPHHHPRSCEEASTACSNSSEETSDPRRRSVSFAVCRPTKFLHRNFDSLQNSLKNIFQFSNDQFRFGLALQTISSLPSKLSTTLDPIDGHKIGQHSLEVQFLNGFFNSKPPPPRSNAIRDPDVVFSNFATLSDNKNLPLTVISHKLSTLIAYFVNFGFPKSLIFRYLSSIFQIQSRLFLVFAPKDSTFVTVTLVSFSSSRRPFLHGQLPS